MYRLSLLLTALILTFSLQAQTIQEQFKALKGESSVWEDYQVIKINKLRDFWGVVSDTLTDYRADISHAQVKIKGLSNEIDSLESSLNDIKIQLAESESVNSSIGFLGMSINKTAYKSLVWLIIASLCAAVGIVYMMFKNTNKVTKQTKHDYSQLEKEYFDYKEKAAKKQVALKRELQTAINTLEENRINISNKLGYNRGSSSIG